MERKYVIRWIWQPLLQCSQQFSSVGDGSVEGADGSNGGDEREIIADLFISFCSLSFGMNSPISM